MSHINSNDGLSADDFASLKFVDDDEFEEKKKKHKKKHKKSKGKKYKDKNKKSYKKKYKTKKKHKTLLDRICDSVDVTLDSEIKVSITDETIDKGINAVVGIARMFRNSLHDKKDNKAPELEEHTDKNN